MIATVVPLNYATIEPSNNGNKSNKLLEPIDNQWRGMAIVLHGLNLKPQWMLPIAQELRQAGIGVLVGALQGHGDNYTRIDGVMESEARLAAYRAVTLKRWLENFDALYQYANPVAEQQKIPLFFVGFSMGALLGSLAIVANKAVQFDRMILFAPAFAIHLHCRLPRLLKYWPNLLIRSMAPATYRANWATPVAAYLAIYAAQQQLWRATGQTLNVPTQIFIAPRDELVSHRGLRSFIRRKTLTNWQVDVVSKQGAADGARLHHIIFEPTGVGHLEWMRMMSKMRQTLLG